MQDEECRRPDWQLPLTRRCAAEKRMRVQLQSAKQELEALMQPAAAAAQLRRDFKAAFAQRNRMTVGPGGGGIKC